jgi:hypothetical protein
MNKRLVKKPMAENRLKWRATKGAVPQMATPVTSRESRIYLKIIFFQEVFVKRKRPSCFRPRRIPGTR